MYFNLKSLISLITIISMLVFAGATAIAAPPKGTFQTLKGLFYLL